MAEIDQLETEGAQKLSTTYSLNIENVCSESISSNPCNENESNTEASIMNVNECGFTEIASQHNTATGNVELFKEIKDIRHECSKHVIISHLNVNSLRPKIAEIKELLRECQFDVLVLSETKLDESIKQEILDIEGYSCVRQDKRSNSGGLLTYISNDIPFSVGSMSLSSNEIECLPIELHVAGEKIMLLGMYKNPKTDPVRFKNYFEETCEKVSDSFENIIVIGDLNFNMFHDNTLSTIIPPLNLTNVINEPTCYKSVTPTLIDVMLVTKRRKILRSFSKNTGISDFHNLIGGVLRIHKPPPKVKTVYVRNFSKINIEKVLGEMSELTLTQQIMTSPDVHAAYKVLQEELNKLVYKRILVTS